MTLCGSVAVTVPYGSNASRASRLVRSLRRFRFASMSRDRFALSSRQNWRSAGVSRLGFRGARLMISDWLE